MKLIEENIGRILFDINYSNIFLDQSAKEMNGFMAINIYP